MPINEWGKGLGEKTNTNTLPSLPSFPIYISFPKIRLYAVKYTGMKGGKEGKEKE
tara:strand:+ start:106 stop:270 length:165 start_codon:yes stop_codon:yes gene_type:complete